MALLALSVGLTALAVPAGGTARWALQLGGAATALAAWAAAAGLAGLDSPDSVDVTAAGAGALALTCAVVLRARPTTRSWAIAGVPRPP